MSVCDHPKVKEWLEECRRPGTKRSHSSRMKLFFKWYGKTIDDFLALTEKERRHAMLLFQNTIRDTITDKKQNGIQATISSVNSFLEYHDLAVRFKGKRNKPEPDLGSHEFSKEDLTRMFEVADTKGKALLTLGTSLGWEISAILEFDREYAQKLINRAKNERKEYYYFRSFRQKTGALRLGVLNPLCIEWLGKWLRESQDMKLRRRKENRVTKDRPISNIFDLTEEGANKLIRRLAEQARIETLGRVHFHKIRGWVMSGLSRAGLNEFQIKFLVGKAIPLTDSTYLQTLQLEIEERYPTAYELHLCLQRGMTQKNIVVLSEQLEAKDKELQALKTKVDQISGSKASLETLLSRVLELEKKLEEKK
ncbi:MAG: hypothetical protein NWF00_06720 [Candidatus Bathyarchaeota archaeon]|nr:hypothetical protein [Candidatus Bathyarchaeota archaeon]